MVSSKASPETTQERQDRLEAFEATGDASYLEPAGATQRRVYALPTEMVDRIVAYQKERGLASEVEAVRRLLDDALKSRDNLERIINRYLSRLGQYKVHADAAREVLVGHPLVRSITFNVEDHGTDTGFEYVEFMLKNETGAQISELGWVTLLGEKTKDWKWKSGETRGSPGRLEDLPF